MQNITVTSTTDSAEAVLAAQGGTAPVESKPEETKPAAETPAETLEASEALDENDTDTEETPNEGKEPKKAKGLEKRIGKLTKQREEARREVDYWKAEALKQKPEPTKPDVIPVKAADSTGKPTPDSFGTHEEYVEALADWKVEQKLSAREATQKQNEIKAQQTSREQAYFKEVAEFVKIKPDFNEVVGAHKLSSITIYESVLDAGKDGPELLYELAKDPEEYERIRNLPAIPAAREIGKIQERLAKSSDAKTTETKTTKAPKPITPVSNSSSTSLKKLEDLDFDDFKKARAAGRTS